ncbi:hypothetical protein [Neotabrizicola sp. sgz301269]|uniref:hypothetical protein n=1 Tax=Neotabrizicola sp. sgz301269 TaxID=3276282 RepID=UPI0037702B59
MTADIHEEFDAKSARTRQPLPLWTGALDRATMEHTPEVIGAYMLILMAMWESKSCDLPADDRFLARITRVSPTIWRRRLAPIILPLLSQKNSRIFSEKLQENAGKTEEYCRKQHERKSGKNTNKVLKNNNTKPTTDKTAETSTERTVENPKPLTINIGKEEEGARTREAGFAEEGQGAVNQPTAPSEPPPSTHPTIPPGLLDDVRAAVGIQSHDTGAYWADPSLAEHVAAWIGSGLAPDRIVAEAKASRAKNPEPPDGPRALDRWMAQAASAKASTALVKPAAKAKPATTPVSPEDRLNFFADWVNGDKLLPASVISPVMARALLESGKVTQERMRERGVR